MKKVFDKYDVDGSGFIDATAVTQAAKGLNVASSPLKHVEGQISFTDFCKVLLIATYRCALDSEAFLLL